VAAEDGITVTPSDLIQIKSWIKRHLSFASPCASLRALETPKMKPLLLKLHRWTGLVFALPLLAIVASGLVLSFEPMVQAESVQARSVEPSKLIDLIKRYDPQNKARGLFIDPSAHRLTLQGAGTPDIDLVTGEAMADRPLLTGIFLWARFTHERLLGLPWLVTTSTIAMTLLMILGIAMGLPRLRNSLAGWHKGAAWFTLPLILLSPLTGLCMAFGLMLQTGAAPNIGRPATLADAVLVVAKSHDLGQVISIGTRGGRMMARLFEGGELRAYAIGKNETVALPRNWPRLIHEGNWSAMIASPLNIVTSVVLLGLIVTGSLIWLRRRLRLATSSTSAPNASVPTGLRA
jgi:uncharacterized iron-regulated membrane protein